jgi:transcriptional regulator with XRE-family HTH domain
MVNVAKRITELKLKKKLSTNKLAHDAGISQSYLRDIELGNVNPTIEKLDRICKALDVSTSEFLSENIEFDNLYLEIKNLSKAQKSDVLKYINTLK